MSGTLGNYELVRHLATGGMAEIWIARQSGPGGFDRELAIKRILPHLAREKHFVSMFLDEARIASALRHPNIVQIYELGEVDDEYFIAMEYIEGADLSDLLDEAAARNVEFPIAISLRIIADILAALDYAHDFKLDDRPQHIVHRDVSPHNVLIGADGIIKLVDFGIAHAVERRAKTETGRVKGKLSYMAPEQIEQDPVDRRADIFAAGVLLYELLTGSPPFGSELAAINAILNDDPPDPRLQRPDLPDELVPIIFRALEKSPGNRFESAQQMHEELEAVLRSFDKYVSPKHVAAFAGRLLSGEALDGYDDVSQAIPRRLSRRAFVEATTATDTPAGLQPATGRSEPAPPKSRDQAVATMGSDADGKPSGRNRWPLIGGFLSLAAIGMVAGAMSTKNSADGATLAPVGAPSVDPPAPVTIELEEQFVAGPEDQDAGFLFDEEELALADLEDAVETLDPAAVERMLVANYERTDEQVLWFVRGPHLLGEFTDPPLPLDPGESRTAVVLGLEKIDKESIKPKPRKRARRVKRSRKPKRRTKPAAAAKANPGARPSETAPNVPAKDASAPSASETVTPRKQNDLRIIDKAVPY